MIWVNMYKSPFWSRIVLKAQRILAGMYKYRSSIIVTNFLILWSPWPAGLFWVMNAEQCAMISGTHILVADLLSPVNYVEGTPQMVDWMEIWVMWRPINTSNSLLSASNIPEPFQLWVSEHYPAERDNGHQEILFPWKVEHGLQWCFDSIHLEDQTFSTKILPQNITLPPPTCFHPIMGPGVTRSPGYIKALASNDLVMMWYGKHMDWYWDVSYWFKGPTYISSLLRFVKSFV